MFENSVITKTGVIITTECFEMTKINAALRCSAAMCKPIYAYCESESHDEDCLIKVEWIPAPKGTKDIFGMDRSQVLSIPSNAIYLMVPTVDVSTYEEDGVIYLEDDSDDYQVEED